MVVSAMAEPMISHRWNRPSASNALWNLLGLNVTPSVTHMPGGEINALMSGSVGDLFARHASVAALMSLGVGMTMQRCNVTGQVLMVMAGLAEGAGSVAGLRTQLVTARSDKPSCGMLMYAVGEIANVSEISISLGPWTGYSWSNNFDHVRTAQQSALWGVVWDFRVPYALKAFSLSLFLSRWPDMFGVFTGGVTLDLVADLQRTGTSSGWYACKGDKTYQAICIGSGVDAARYIPYGAAVINAITLHSRRNSPYALLLQRFPRNSTAATTGVAPTAPNALEPGDYVTGLSMWATCI